MNRSEVIILNIGIISMLVYLSSRILDIFNPYMNLNGTLGFTLYISVAVMFYMLIVLIRKVIS